MAHLADFLNHQMKINAWSLQKLADEIGISKSGVVYILDNPDSIPKLETLVLIRKRFNMPLWRVVEMAGLPLDLPENVTPQQYAAALAQSSPQLGVIINQLLALDPESLEGVLAYLEGQRIARDRRGQ
jgi:hypothetical protein